MGRFKVIEQLIKTKTERFSYDNVFLEAELDDIEYLPTEDIEDYYSNADEVFVEQGEVLCFIESILHEPNCRFIARKDFVLLVHEDKNGNVSILVPLDDERHLLVPTDNYNPATDPVFSKYCDKAVKGKVKIPTTLIIKNN